jgi:hypothetical protein
MASLLAAKEESKAQQLKLGADLLKFQSQKRKELGRELAKLLAEREKAQAEGEAQQAPPTFAPLQNATDPGQATNFGSDADLISDIVSGGRGVKVAQAQGGGQLQVSPEQRAEAERLGIPPTTTRTTTIDEPQRGTLMGLFGGRRQRTVTETAPNIAGIAAARAAEATRRQELLDDHTEGLASAMFEVGQGNATDEDVALQLQNIATQFGREAAIGAFFRAQAQSRVFNAELTKEIITRRATKDKFEDPKVDKRGNLTQRNRDTGEVKILVKASERATQGAPAKITDVLAAQRSFTTQSREFKIVRDNFRGVMASAEDPSAAGDLALIFSFMKLIDPGSVVRESEFATAETAAGVPERLRNLYNKLETGRRLGNPLSIEDAEPGQTRADFVDRAKKLYLGRAKGQIELEGQFKEFATRNNMRAEDVAVDFLGDLRPIDDSIVSQVGKEIGSGDTETILDELERRGFNTTLVLPGKRQF